MSPCIEHHRWLQLSKDFNEPTIILQVYPAWLPNVTTGRDGFNQTQQYEQGMSQLYAQVSAYSLRV